VVGGGRRRATRWAFLLLLLLLNPHSSLGLSHGRGWVRVYGSGCRGRAPWPAGLECLAAAVADRGWRGEVPWAGDKQPAGRADGGGERRAASSVSEWQGGGRLVGGGGAAGGAIAGCGRGSPVH
jgi:hypothetical protein